VSYLEVLVDSLTAAAWAAGCMLVAAIAAAVVSAVFW
jgi:hypothetical protein